MPRLCRYKSYLNSHLSCQSPQFVQQCMRLFATRASAAFSLGSLAILLLILLLIRLLGLWPEMRVEEFHHHFVDLSRAGVGIAAEAVTGSLDTHELDLHASLVEGFMKQFGLNDRYSVILFAMYDQERRIVGCDLGYGISHSYHLWLICDLSTD